MLQLVQNGVCSSPSRQHPWAVNNPFLSLLQGTLLPVTDLQGASGLLSFAAFQLPAYTY